MLRMVTGRPQTTSKALQEDWMVSLYIFPQSSALCARKTDEEKSFSVYFQQVSHLSYAKTYLDKKELFWTIVLWINETKEELFGEN